MNQQKDILPVIEGIILEEQDGLSLAELCRLCRIHADYVLDLVEEGIIEPSGENVPQYQFHGRCVVRTQKAIRLQKDMGLNLPGVAMVLDLLDEVEELRQRICQMEKLHGKTTGRRS